MVVMSQRMPQRKQSNAYLLPLLLALAVIGMATYYVVNALSRSSDDEEMFDINE
jgi:hypothetical protein